MSNDECISTQGNYLPHLSRANHSDFQEIRRILQRTRCLEAKCGPRPLYAGVLPHSGANSQEGKYREAIGFYEPIVRRNYDALLGISAIVLANLCVSYIMTSQNDQVSHVMHYRHLRM